MAGEIKIDEWSFRREQTYSLLRKIGTPMTLIGFAILVIVFLILIVFGSQLVPDNLLAIVIPGVIASILFSVGLIILLIARLAFRKEKIFTPMFSLEEIKKH